MASSPKSVLSAIWHFVKKAFSPGAIAVEAKIAEVALPGLSGLIGITASSIINAENAAIAAGVQTGTGEQKAAIVVSDIEKTYTDFATTNGIPVIPANIKGFVDAIVLALNSFPPPPAAVTGSTPPSTTTVTTGTMVTIP